MLVVDEVMLEISGDGRRGDEMLEVLDEVMLVIGGDIWRWETGEEMLEVLVLSVVAVFTCRWTITAQ